MGVGFGVN